MDLQTRKLNLISCLAQIQDESILVTIEDILLKETTESDKIEFKPFTIEELKSRIKKSEKDFKNGNFKTQAELEKIMEKW
ncbi:hypothetical protein [Autumnicola musiva]|uniref:Uncharacterized protein n=1 Tax=Autumnicola musiva TaxID=3075589 RepID=A0ABU3D1U7_9FLAO|nr:hypothetical protein [Zunongwangia sp. F117]MDT0674988.1 hypothetical protein [Zunongwangia sp. F117]